MKKLIRVGFSFQSTHDKKWYGYGGLEINTLYYLAKNIEVSMELFKYEEIFQEIIENVEHIKKTKDKAKKILMKMNFKEINK